MSKEIIGRKNIGVYNYRMRFTFFAFFALISIQFSIAQIHYQPYSFQHYQRYLKDIYIDSLQHTAVKPLIGYNFDPKFEIKEADVTTNWWKRKLFEEHLIEVFKDDYTFYMDFMPEFIIGKESGTHSNNLWTNTRGVQAGLSVNERFTIYANFYENQARLPSFIDSTATHLKTLPGQGAPKRPKSGEFDWMNSTANLAYHVADEFKINLAYDKIHIGEGYRSVLLSDSPFNTTYLKLSGDINRWQYNSIWSYMNDRMNPRVQEIEDPESPRQGGGIKYGIFNYVDYRFSDKVSLGMLHSLIWAKKVSNVSQGTNGGVGLNIKYTPWQNYVLYGQMYADELSKVSFGKDSDSRTAFQLGLHGIQPLDIENLNVTVELNQAAPYTYQHPNNRINYSSNGESLAHPKGANFRELLGIVTYRWKRWDIYGQTMFSKYGLDQDENQNVGADIFKENITENSFRIGQGQRNKLWYNELRLSYVMNPKYNLRWELGYINRVNKNQTLGDKVSSSIISFGLKSSFRAFQAEY